MSCFNCYADVDYDDLFCSECGQELGANKNQATKASPMLTLGGLETLDDTQTKSRVSETTPILETGTTFADRYVIKNVIGRGGMGVVYRAQDQLAAKNVALKLIRPERLAGTNAVQRLISEGITARDIRHPNIIAVYDVGDSNGQPFVSMEYLAGDSLRDWHRKKIQAREDIPLKVAALIITEILNGLKAAHNAGVIHRDLKPDNIILVQEPTEKAAPLKILDFGIARAIGNATDSSTGTGLGTPRYMAPEQITNPDTATPSSDLYSLSIIFYELLVDVLPQGHWQPPSGGRSDISSLIDTLIEKGLSNRPGNRPQTAEIYRQALADAMDIKEEPQPSDQSNDFPTPSGPKEREGKSSKLKWIKISTAGILGITAINYFLPDDDLCSHLSGASYEACINPGFYDDLEITPDPDDSNANLPISPSPSPSPPPSPPPPSIYKTLNGEWNDGLGTIYTINIDRSGQFDGSGYAVDGTLIMISGKFTNQSATYTVRAPSVGVALNGSAQWDRKCHINFRTFDIYNQGILEQGQMHVNHAPGGPCPQ